MRFGFIIFSILTIEVFGQSSHQLDIQSNARIITKHLVVELNITNKTADELYINTEGIWIAMDSLESPFNELSAYLESKKKAFIPYNVITEFRQYDNVKKEVRKLNKINKYPNIKITPKRCLTLKEGIRKPITIRIPLKYWSLTKGEKYNLTIKYSRPSDKEEHTDQNLKETAPWIHTVGPIIMAK